MGTRTQLAAGNLMRNLLLLFLVTTVGCASTQTHESGPPIVHVVVCWLNQPGDAQARQRVIDTSRGFLKTIDGLERVQAGAVHPTTRPTADSSFDVAIVMTFRDAAALDAYETSEAHRRALREVLHPLVSKLVSYDIIDKPVLEKR